MNNGAFDFITKPIDIADLKVTLEKAIAEMVVFKQGLEAKNNLQQALIEKAEAQEQALINLKEKEQLILHQNEMLEKQVIDRTAEIIRQKELIEIKNKEILDSIYYARRLQEAILPPSSALREYFADSFLIYMPRDIVSGDFYWLTETENEQVLVAADCTGHGVAGALMSMLGMSLLNHIVIENAISSPGEVLDRLSAAVIHALKQNNSESHEGMDLVYCRFGPDNILEFAGANRPLWIVRKGELLEFKTDKMPIGGMQYERRPFVKQTFQLQPQDQVYVFTDGFADQFGGEHGKKLMTKSLRNIILETSSCSAEEQKKHLQEHFFSWKGAHEQVDDVLLIGIRIADN
jgi:serine phosphatase RsbU (regulator of sigma subunit)